MRIRSLIIVLKWEKLGINRILNQESSGRATSNQGLAELIGAKDAHSALIIAS